MKTIQVLLVDDHAIVRAGLRMLLNTAGDMLVIGEAENGEQAVQEAKRLRPDVVVLDLAMPRLNGMEAARRLAQAAPNAKVLILSSYNDAQHLRQAVEAGVAGYLIKESAADDLLEAVRAADRGKAFFSAPVLKHLVNQWDKGSVDDLQTATAPVSLSLRQAEVLQLIAEGYCTKQIASMLTLGEKTVEKHRQALMDRLKLHKIADLTRYAVSNGVIESNRVPDLPASPAPIQVSALQ